MAAAVSAATEDEPAVFNGGCYSTTEEAGTAAAPCGWPSALSERYKQAIVVGQGMFGRVYAAWDSIEGQIVAVKQLSGRTDSEFVVTGPREFAQEVMALQACRGHPNVVKLLATFYDDNDDHGIGGNRFIITEFAGPMNLRRYMQQRHREDRPPFSEDEVRDAMSQLLSAVACAHEAGVVHREVVPENVIVDEEHYQQQQEAKEKKRTKTKKASIKYTVCGFNVSEQSGQTAEKDALAHLASSSAYRAPELLVGSESVYDERIDTWGLGCIMAELLAGEGVPFFRDALDAEGLLQVVDGKGLVEWPRLQHVATPVSKLLEEHDHHTGFLRAMFPRKKLSRAGFNVLSGLLQIDPEHRLTAAAALEMPWFRRRGHTFGTCFTSRGR